MPPLSREDLISIARLSTFGTIGAIVVSLGIGLL
jgi:hypothetical protein